MFICCLECPSLSKVLSVVEGDDVGLGISEAAVCRWTGRHSSGVSSEQSGQDLVSQQPICASPCRLPSFASPSVSHPEKGFREHYLMRRPAVGSV